MADFLFNCPQCGNLVNANEEWRGQQSQCPHCATTITIPVQSEPSATALIKSLSPDERKCPQCGEIIKKEAGFCRWCHKTIAPVQYDISPNFSSSHSELTRANSEKSSKKSVIAFVLGFFFVGLGVVYLGQVGKGLVIFFLALCVGFLFDNFWLSWILWLISLADLCMVNYKLRKCGYVGPWEFFPSSPQNSIIPIIGAKNTTEGDEVVILTRKASLFRGIEGVGGTLSLTNRRVIFYSHAFSIQSGNTEIPLSVIKSVYPCNTLKIVPNGMKIETKSAIIYQFVLFGRQDVIDQISKFIREA